MSNDGGKEARDAAEAFGVGMEDAARDIEDGVCALFHGAPAEEPKPIRDDDGDVNIPINR